MFRYGKKEHPSVKRDKSASTGRTASFGPRKGSAGRHASRRKAGFPSRGPNRHWASETPQGSWAWAFAPDERAADWRFFIIFAQTSGQQHTWPHTAQSAGCFFGLVLPAWAGTAKITVKIRADHFRMGEIYQIEKGLFNQTVGRWAAPGGQCLIHPPIPRQRDGNLPSNLKDFIRGGLPTAAPARHFR